MSKVNLNKISVKQQGGQMIPGQPAMQTGQGVPSMIQPQQQVDPAIQQISQFFTESIQQGAKPEEVVMNLMQQEVDQGTIAQALMTVGYAEQDITVLFKNVQMMGQPGKASAKEVNANPQELARNQELAQQQEGPVSVDPIEMAKSGIEIDPKNKGKFTRWAKARGMSVKEAYNKVMSNTDAYPPSVVKMANFAKNAAGWKKEEGGEPDNEGFRALPDFVQNKIMKRQTGGEEEETEKDEVSLTDEQKAQNAMMQKFLEASNVTLTNQNNQIIGGKNPSSSDEGILKTKNYFNPNAFKTGNNFSLGKAANVLNNAYQDMFAGDEDGDGLKDGSFRDWKNKTINNKINKELDANYKVELDLSDENKAAAQAWKKQYDIENPAVDELGNVIEQEKFNEDGSIDTSIEITNTPVQQVTEDFSNWFEENTDGLSETAKATYDALRKKLLGDKDAEVTVQAYGSEIPKALFGFGKRAKKAMQDPMSVARVAAGDFSAMQNLMMEGGPLPKAQFSTPDTGAPFATQNESEPKTFQEWVIEDPITRGSADAQQQYQAYVDGFNSDAAPDATPDATEDGGTEEPKQRTAADLFTDIQGPKVEKDYGGLGGFVDRTINSNVARAFGDVSNFAVEAADVVNDWFEDKNIKDAKDDLRANLVADNLYGTKTDAFNKRGTFDINSGLMGSEGDRTTGLYMSKQGGGVNNPGFKALPPEAQHNILSNMAYGGAKGAEAYLENRDSVIKREMAKAQDGNKEETGKNHPYYKEYLEKFEQEGISKEKDALKILREMNVTPTDTLMINKGYNKNQARTMNNMDLASFVAKDIYADGTGVVNQKNKMPYFTSTPDEDGMSWDFARSFYKADDYDGLNNIVEVLKSKQPNNDASLMKLFGLQQGGETVNVDSTMLAKLIAAGADIEML
tara:strand:- start:94 stop:2823 length:2730 start_codon:yes stop_codon:yes gene_type:complete